MINGFIKIFIDLKILRLKYYNWDKYIIRKKIIKDNIPYKKTL